MGHLDRHATARRRLDAGARQWAAEYPRWPALHQVQEVFGSWNAAIRAAGYTPRQVRWTEAAIVHAAQGWTRRHGQPPRIEQWRRTAPDGLDPSMRPVLDAFGTWNAMLLAAGLTVVHRNWSQAEVLEALAHWVAAHGRAPTMADWRRPQPPGAFPTAQCAADHFGTWNAMLCAGGLTPARRRWTREEILEACAEFQRCHRRPPATAELCASHGLPSVGTVHRQIGEYRALLAALAAHRPGRGSRPPRNG